ncbi:MAG: phage portal protein [Lysobacteraceae bacterium]
MNVLDRAIAWVAPTAALKRARARAALGLVRGYEGAKTGRRTAGWTSGTSSANAEIGPAASRLRQRCRDLFRNNPLAASILRVMVSNLVGTGIVVKVSDPALQAKWEQFVLQCDADGVSDLYGLTALVAQSWKESGEVLVRLRPRTAADGLAVPLQLQVLEIDHLDTSKEEDLGGGRHILQGIQFDALGRREGYWLFPQHPGEAGPIRAALVSRFVPADQVLHIFSRTRPGQIRGVPALAPVMLKLRDLDDYQEAELLRKGIESCFAAFVTNPNGTQGSMLGADASQTDAKGTRDETIAAGMVKYLGPGESVEFGTPSSVSGFNEFITNYKREITSGAGVPHELATGNLTDVNYTSHRAGLVEYRRQVEQEQWLVLIHQFLRPVVAAFQRYAAISGVRNALAATAEYTPPKFDWVDPVKDATGELIEVAAGLKPWQEAVRRRGFDPERVVEQIKEDQARFEAAGVKVQIGDLLLGAVATAINQGSRE